MSKQEDAHGAGKTQEPQADQANTASGKTTKVAGAEFPVGADEVLTQREYDDRIVVVTRDGQKLSQPKPKKAAK